MNVISSLTDMCLSAGAAETRKDTADTTDFFFVHSLSIRSVRKHRDTEIIFALDLIDPVNLSRNYDVAFVCKMGFGKWKLRYDL